MSGYGFSAAALAWGLAIAVPSASHAAVVRALPSIPAAAAFDVTFKKPRLFVGTDGGGFEPPAINVYDSGVLFPEPLYQITSGVEFGAWEMAMDSSGRLYVADPDVGVLEYAARGTSPMRTLSTSGYSDAFGVALDSAGTIYVVTGPA